MDCSPLGSSVHEILQEGILEWVAICFYGGIQDTQEGEKYLQPSNN